MRPLPNKFNASGLKSLSEGARQPGRRRLAYAAAAAAFAALSLFPRPYVARGQLLPQGENSAGLSAVLGAIGGGLQNFASLVGTHETIEVYLLIGHSDDVATEVIQRLHLVGTHGYHTLDQAKVGLSHKVDLHSLTGGVLEIRVKDWDPAYAKALVNAYASAIQDRVADLSREQTAKKKAVVSARFRETAARVAEAQAEMDSFRRANKLADPTTQLGAAIALRAAAQGELQAKQVALKTAEQFGTAENFEVKTLRADIAALQAQIAKAETTSAGVGGANLSGLAAKSTEYMSLYRNEHFEEVLYETYARSLEQVSVEDLIANTNTNVQIIEAPHIVPGRQLNLPFVGALLAVFLLAFYTEYYVPMTRLGVRRSEVRPEP